MENARLSPKQGSQAATIGPETMRHFRLSNGIHLVVQENHAAASVVLRGYLWAGSVSDPAEKLGLAAFTAASLMRGTETRSFAEINETLESVAAAAYIAGGRHLTSFGGKSLAEDLDLLVDVLADALLHPAFPDTQIEQVRGQLITGLKELEDDTRGVAGRAFRRLLYGEHHPYGTPGSGTLETVPNIGRQDLIDFYGVYYRPRSSAIVVVGDVEAEKIRAVLEAKLGKWLPDSNFEPEPLPAVEPLTETRRYRRLMDNKTQTDLVLGTLGPSRRDADYHPAWIGNVILGQLGLMGRLGQNVRDRQGLAYYAYSGLEGKLGPGPWSIVAGVSPDKIDQAIASILDEVRRMRDEPVADEELEDSRDFLIGSLPLRLETNEGIAANLLNIILFDLGDDYIIRYPDIVRSVTKADIQAAAIKYLNPDVYALSIAGPDKES